MSLDNNFNEENKAHELWEKIDIILENKNAVNRVSVFQKIVRLKYQDDSSMAEHMNAFQGLINYTTSLEVPLADEVLALLLLRSLLDSWETQVVTLANAGPGDRNLLKGLSREIGTGEEAETEVLKTEKSWGRGQSQGGGLLVSIARNQGSSRGTSDTSEGIKGAPTDGAEPKAHPQSRQAKKSYW